MYKPSQAKVEHIKKPPCGGFLSYKMISQVFYLHNQLQIEQS